MEIKVAITVTQEVLENAIITALEGGSNYWYFLSDKALKITREAVPEYLDIPLSTAIAKAVFEYGATIPINDYESMKKKIGELSASTMRDRIQALAADEGYSHALVSEMDGNGDGNTSDIVFQYMCLGCVEFA